MAKKTKFPSELRFDSVSKDWVVIATGRGKRPEMFKQEKRARAEISPKDCPFCHPSDRDGLRVEENSFLLHMRPARRDLIRDLSLRRFERQEVPILEKKSVVVIPNKYPAFLPSAKLEKRQEGEFYLAMRAAGFCELVITRDHKKSLALLPQASVREVIDCYQERYLDLMAKPNVNYISIFHNHGAEAGASQVHPHSQIVTTPLIDSDLEKALFNSERYFKEKKKCLYCQLNEWEKKVGERIVFENEDFLVVAPFASKAAFEIIVSPKNHLPYFERINEKEKQGLAEALKAALLKLYKGLGDPAYNFYLHTSPCDGKDYSYYHWHWTILPKTAVWAGFEIGTRMEISTIEPEKAAEYLRSQ